VEKDIIEDTSYNDVRFCINDSIKMLFVSFSKVILGGLLSTSAIRLPYQSTEIENAFFHSWAAASRKVGLAARQFRSAI
jgi:hypothetical protein